MCIATKRLNEFKQLVEDLSIDLKVLYGKLSECDRKINDHYHKVETAKFNACEGFYLTQHLQKLLQARRIVKDEIHKLKCLRRELDNEVVVETIVRSERIISKAKNRSAKWQQNFVVDKKELELETLH
ncbi:hypothetical protein [Lederbergia lenta]|uniref:hypothetical protein n=1 Tax=Lederbergia lenta TaxID=1467 RepID=UPI00203BF2C1|nr:hypothetical protein [Lederbergia lenta]MCM3109957.1 hypothetical protein [Lederbergia lenta]